MAPRRKKAPEPRYPKRTRNKPIRFGEEEHSDDDATPTQSGKKNAKQPVNKSGQKTPTKGGNRNATIAGNKSGNSSKKSANNSSNKTTPTSSSKAGNKTTKAVDTTASKLVGTAAPKKRNSSAQQPQQAAGDGDTDDEEKWSGYERGNTDNDGETEEAGDCQMVDGRGQLLFDFAGETTEAESVDSSKGPDSFNLPGASSSNALRMETGSTAGSAAQPAALTSPATPLNFEDVMAHPGYPRGGPYRPPSTDPAFDMFARERANNQTSYNNRSSNNNESSHNNAFTMSNYHAYRGIPRPSDGRFDNEFNAINQARNRNAARGAQRANEDRFDNEFIAINQARELDARQDLRAGRIPPTPAEPRRETENRETMDISFDFETGDESDVVEEAVANPASASVATNEQPTVEGPSAPTRTQPVANASSSTSSAAERVNTASVATGTQTTASAGPSVTSGAQPITNAGPSVASGAQHAATSGQTPVASLRRGQNMPFLVPTNDRDFNYQQLRLQFMVSANAHGSRDPLTPHQLTMAQLAADAASRKAPMVRRTDTYNGIPANDVPFRTRWGIFYTSSGYFPPPGWEFAPGEPANGGRPTLNRNARGGRQTLSRALQVEDDEDFAAFAALSARIPSLVNNSNPNAPPSASTRRCARSNAATTTEALAASGSAASSSTAATISTAESATTAALASTTTTDNNAATASGNAQTANDNISGATNNAQTVSGNASSAGANNSSFNPSVFAMTMPSQDAAMALIAGLKVGPSEYNVEMKDDETDIAQQIQMLANQGFVAMANSMANSTANNQVANDTSDSIAGGHETNNKAGKRHKSLGAFQLDGYESDGDDMMSVASDEEDTENESSSEKNMDAKSEASVLQVAHQPSVAEKDTFNPRVNPAAVLWFTRNNPLDPLNPSLPRLDTDPMMPFAPWNVASLPGFIPERVDRVVHLPGRFVACVGVLYPDAVFVISVHPASRNSVQRLKGATIAKMMAVNFPRLTAHSPELTNATDREYIISLRTRDWPVGGVAKIPNHPEAIATMDAVKQAFDVLPGGAEVWFYVPYRDGDETGIWVCRGYEGCKGPQGDAVLRQWCEVNAQGVGEDAEGKKVLSYMGEAWVEPDMWPKPTKAQRMAMERKKEKAQMRAEAQIQAKVEEDESEWE